jgi:hypothetical protein
MRSGDDYEHATPLDGKAPHGLFDEAGDLAPGRVGASHSTEERVERAVTRHRPGTMQV